MPVSVVIPAYRAEATLARAVRSCLAQGEAVGEILIVENNSPDGTLAVATQLSTDHPALVKVIQQPIQGASAARNLGIRAATNEWIQYLDADDELLPGKLARQLPCSTPKPIG